MDAIGQRLFESNFGKTNIATSDVILQMIRGASKQVQGHKFSERFLLTEWEQVVDTWQLDSWEAYRDVKRLGRKTKVDIAFNKKLGAGFFGGEGFIMQRLTGDGLAFVHAGGTIVERELRAGETLRIDTGCIVGFTRTVDYDIQMVKGLKSMFFGGEGMVFATATGPGHVWLQSLPFSRLAGRIFAAAPQMGGRQGEGSVLGGLGNILDGD